MQNTIPTKTPTPESKNRYEDNATKKGTYPKSKCGKVRGKPFYPIYIPRNNSNLDRVKREFCKEDARDLGDKIMVATFSEEVEAYEFLDFIGKHLPGAWMGEPQ